MLIPAFNAAGSIGPVVEGIRRQGCDVFVIDDGSTDATGDISARAGAQVLRQARNQGKGAALQAGFAEALRRSYDAIITMDADGQHAPQDLPRFVEAASVHPEAAMIIGNRMAHPRSMPWVRRWTNRVMSWWLSRLAGCGVPDTQCGFRLLRRDFVARARCRSQRFEIESELVLEAARLGLVIESLPIACHYGNERSHIHPVRDTVRFLQMVRRIRREPHAHA